MAADFGPAVRRSSAAPLDIAAIMWKLRFSAFDLDQRLQRPRASVPPVGLPRSERHCHAEKHEHDRDSDRNNDLMCGHLSLPVSRARGSRGRGSEELIDINRSLRQKCR
jgi:hypothetical protein